MTLIERPSPPHATLPASERTQPDLATTRPGTPGGIFMRQFWHAVYRSSDLPAGHARPVRIMSEDYALYRGRSGTAQVVDYRCPHRGAPMHLGWVEDDGIRCAYHGWKFDCAGQCVEQPAEEPASRIAPTSASDARMPRSSCGGKFSPASCARSPRAAR